MKTGKYLPLGYYQNVKLGYGTVDYKNLKTVYVKLNSWLLPEDDDNYNNIISKTRRNIKNFIYSLNNSYFQKECSVELDVRTKGIKLEKRSFMSLELTLFVKSQFDVKEIKNLVKETSVHIVDNNLTDKNLFNFYKNKKT